jgi:cyclophilin family peptidyl-prolyl cis-trans isomerase
VLAQPGAVVPPARLAILQAEERRAQTAADLLTLRTGVRSRDPLTAVLAIRAIGRLERPALAADLVPALDHALPEVRAEAANAIGQAAQGANASGRPAGAFDPGSMMATLLDRLAGEELPSVRAALCGTLGRLPYQTPDQVAAAEAALINLAKSNMVADRLGVATGFEALVRLHRGRRPLSDPAIAALRELAGVDDEGPADPDARDLRDARVRRLAVEALITADAVDDHFVIRAASDPDPQVRRFAMRAGAASGKGTGVLAQGLDDPSAMVRLEALRGFATRRDDGACNAFVAATRDVETHIALVALDQMAVCAGHAAALGLLEATVNDLSAAGADRGWHRAAHAIAALAVASPSQAASALGQFVSSTRWQLRIYAARAAISLGNREVLRTLAADPDDNVVETALQGLSKISGHDDDPLYIRALTRSGYQAIRAAAFALDGTPQAAEAVTVLKAAWTRLSEENHDNSFDTRAALAATLTGLGAPPPPVKASPPAAASVLSIAELRRLAAPRARITVRGLGAFEIALFTSEAPATVLRFAALAEAGYYDGRTFHRVVPNFVIQGGSPGANEYVGLPEFMRDEVGLWPHVRGAVGISTRGRDRGDAQIFVNLVDNPRFDHEYTVFAQVLNGMEVVDRILEGDVIDDVEIRP